MVQNSLFHSLGGLLKPHTASINRNRRNNSYVNTAVVAVQRGHQVGCTVAPVVPAAVVNNDRFACNLAVRSFARVRAQHSTKQRYIETLTIQRANTQEAVAMLLNAYDTKTLKHTPTAPRLREVDTRFTSAPTILPTILVECQMHKVAQDPQ